MTSPLQHSYISPPPCDTKGGCPYRVACLRLKQDCASYRRYTSTDDGDSSLAISLRMTKLQTLKEYQDK